MKPMPVTVTNNNDFVVLDISLQTFGWVSATKGASFRQLRRAFSNNLPQLGEPNWHITQFMELVARTPQPRAVSLRSLS